MDEIQRAGYDRVFDVYAYDGYTTCEGFDRHTRVLAEMQGRSPDAPAIVSLREELRSTWESLATMADFNHDGRINRDELRVSAEGITASLGRLGARARRRHFRTHPSQLSPDTPD